MQCLCLFLLGALVLLDFHWSYLQRRPSECMRRVKEWAYWISFWTFKWLGKFWKGCFWDLVYRCQSFKSIYKYLHHPSFLSKTFWPLFLRGKIDRLNYMLYWQHLQPSMSTFELAGYFRILLENNMDFINIYSIKNYNWNVCFFMLIN